MLAALGEEGRVGIRGDDGGGGRVRGGAVGDGGGRVVVVLLVLLHREGRVRVDRRAAVHRAVLVPVGVVRVLLAVRGAFVVASLLLLRVGLGGREGGLGWVVVGEGGRGGVAVHRGRLGRVRGGEVGA